MPLEPALASYTPNRLRRLCRRLMQTTPAYLLPDERLTIQDVHSNLLPAGRSIAGHTHSFYEAHIVFSGEAVVSAPRPLQVNTGSALLLSPQTSHSWETREQPMQSFVIWFHREVTPAEAPLRWAYLPGLLWVLQLILLEVQGGEAGWHDRGSALLSSALSRILAFSANTRPVIAVTEDDMQLVPLIDHFLWDNLGRSLTVAAVAAHVGMSERNLYRRFHALTGQTIMQRLLALRIQRAQTLLEESDASLADIGLRVGISDPAYFCRCFKQRTGTTPHQYRLYMRP